MNDEIRPVCLTPWDSQGQMVWDAVNNTHFTCLRGCGGGGYQASYILCRNVQNADVAKICGFDAFQHYGWRRSESFGPLTTGCGRVRGDTPLIIEVANE